MQKRKQAGAILLAFCMLLNGCDSAQKQETDAKKEGDVVNIYCWNTEFKNLYAAYAADLAESHGVEVNFVVITNDNSAYQINLDEALSEQNELIDDVNTFHNMSDELQKQTDRVQEYAKSISNSVLESSYGIHSAAANTEKLSSQISNISTKILVNKEVANSLSKEAERFVI